MKIDAARGERPARIEYLKVQSFRALREVEFKSLTPLTVLLGPNGSGKSTVFDVFAFLAECFELGLRRAWDKRGRAKELKTRGRPWDARATDHWQHLRAIFEGVAHGHTEWNVPAYNGGLFSTDVPGGPLLDRVALTNATLAPTLLRLAFDKPDDEAGKIDFSDRISEVAKAVRGRWLIPPGGRGTDGNPGASALPPAARACRSSDSAARRSVPPRAASRGAADSADRRGGR